MRSVASFTACAILGLTIAACGGAQAREPAVELGAWSYTITLDEPLSTMQVRLCFEGAPPAAIAPIHNNGWHYVRNVEGRARTAEGLSTRDVAGDGCVGYEVDLARAAADSGGMNGALRVRGDVLASTAVWLWAPSPRPARCVARARFELPQGVRVSSLWPRDAAGTYALDERAFAFVAYAGLGRFQSVDVGAPGACLHVEMLGGGLSIGAGATARAIATSAHAASTLFGHFPVPEASILVIPIPGRDIPFGIVGRGTTPTVALIVGSESSEDELARAWVPVHELSHLATPYIARQDAWLSEGLATYYQEILRARAGMQSAERAWANLDEGFRRGSSDGTGRTLAEESADMMGTAAFARVYWAGTAILFAADVELRRRTGGASSLDRALARLAGERRTQPMSASELVAAIDEQGVIAALVARWLGATEFPDLRETYDALGLARRGGELALEGGAEAAALRASIVRVPDRMAPLGCGTHGGAHESL